MPYNDTGSTIIKTDAIFSVAATLDIGPGVKTQALHRDDFIWQQTHIIKEQREYKIGTDVSMGLMVPCVDTNKANGATLVNIPLAIAYPENQLTLAPFVSGSHLWDHGRRPRLDEAMTAEMTVEEPFLFLGSTAHAGGANTTSQSRPIHGFFYCCS